MFNPVLKHARELQVIAGKTLALERTGLFTEDELKFIRAKAFLSCVESGQVCLSAAAVAHLFHRSPTTIRTWCWNGKIKCIKDYRGKAAGDGWPWYEIPLREVVNLKDTDGNVDEYIDLDITILS